jgi:hypothetical protein
MMCLCSRLAAATLALCLAAGAAGAQQRAQPPAPAATPAPAPAPAPQPQFTPAHLGFARDVAIASGITRSFDAILPQFADQIRQQMVTRPELTKDLNEVLKNLEPEMELQKQQMVNTTARVFAARMTEAELKDVAEFFKSPSGLKYVQAQPLVLDELVKEMQTWTQNVAEYIMVRVRAEMGKRGHHLQ